MKWTVHYFRQLVTSNRVKLMQDGAAVAFLMLFWPALTLSPQNKLSSAKFLVCFNFQSTLILLNVCENFCLSVKQLGSGWDANLFDVSSGSKLFAYGTIVLLGGQRVKQSSCINVSIGHLLDLTVSNILTNQVWKLCTNCDA